MKYSLEVRFKKAYQDFIRKPKIEKYIQILNAKLKKLKKQSKVLYGFMEKEYLDIELLEKKGLQSTFKSFLGSLEEALNKERQEYLLAVLNFQANEKEIAALSFQLDILNRKFIELATIEDRFKKLRGEYFISINLNNKGKAKKIKQLKEKVIRHHSRQAEIRQAKKSGIKAEQALNKLRGELEKIDFWGVPDTKTAMAFGGKGRNSSYKKRRYVDRTKSLTFKVNGMLNRFNEELDEVSRSLKIDFSGEIKSIQDFLNLFFDNLITDWIVKNKINSAFMALDMIHDKIIRIDHMLNFENKRIQDKIDELAIRESEILLS